MTRLALLAALTLAFASPALAQNSTASGTSQKPSAMTEKFVKNAAMTDMFEIQTGEMVEQKVDNDAYKKFAQMIVSDHTKSSDKLKSLAGSLSGITVPQELDKAHQEKMSKLQSFSGARLENQFRAAQIKGHEQAIKLYQNYASKGDSPELKQFAQETLPTLQEHLKAAEALPKGGRAPTVGSGSGQKQEKY
jgi:putative membrane protein